METLNKAVFPCANYIVHVVLRKQKQWEANMRDPPSPPSSSKFSLTNTVLYNHKFRKLELIISNISELLLLFFFVRDALNILFNF